MKNSVKRLLVIPMLALSAGLTAGTLVGCDREPKKIEAKNVKLETNDDYAQIGTAIDIQRFSFEQKDEFKSYIQSRLDAVDRAIDSLKSQSVIGAQTGSGTVQTESNKDIKTKYTAQIEDLESSYNKVEDKVSKIGKTDHVKWEVVKTEFRDDVAALEKKYQDILTASR